MDVIRDVLDKQLIDRHGRPMGKADGVIMEVEEGRQPRLAFIETGAVTQAARLSKRLAKWVEALVRRAGADRESERYRIPWSKLVVTGIDITVNVEAEETPAFTFERWLRSRVIGRIPGA
jgi:sporulation protein YlmC with PRC-barrel domain